jgi:hypothetical protein
VWAGVMNNTLIGPFFIEGNLNSNSFLGLLQEQIIPQIQNLNVNDVWFQMNGAPPHSTAMITRYLNEIFEKRWIGRFGPTAWPPRSPDLSPNDFFLWGHLKDKIYNNVMINNTDELKDRIRHACNELDPNFIRNCVQGFHNRLAYYLEREGGHFEYLIK